MIPKQYCIEAVKKEERLVIIDGKVKHALLKELFSSKRVGIIRKIETYERFINRSQYSI